MRILNDENYRLFIICFNIYDHMGCESYWDDNLDESWMCLLGGLISLGVVIFG